MIGSNASAEALDLVRQHEGLFTDGLRWMEVMPGCSGGSMREHRSLMIFDFDDQFLYNIFFLNTLLCMYVCTDCFILTEVLRQTMSRQLHSS